MQELGQGLLLQTNSAQPVSASDSCQKTPFSSQFLLVYGTVASLILVLLPLSVWKLHR